MRELVKAFKALSDSNRIRILKMLEVRPLCVCEIFHFLPIKFTQIVILLMKKTVNGSIII